MESQSMDAFLFITLTATIAGFTGYILGMSRARHTLTDGIPVVDMGPFGENQPRKFGK